MFCNNFGAQLPDGMRFCDQCGAPVEPDTAQPERPDMMQPGQPPYMNRPDMPMGRMPAMSP